MNEYINNIIKIYNLYYFKNLILIIINITIYKIKNKY